MRILLTVILLALSCQPVEHHQPKFFVSPAGDDLWSGQLSEPNRDKSDGPFRTLEQARQAVRDYRDSRPT
ncbi:MAG TPA: hypothetical protein PKN24_16775, partial [bacterium]|nr:hypothetical protein [bacterium]